MNRFCRICWEVVKVVVAIVVVVAALVALVIALELPDARRGYAFIYGNGDWETCGADGSGKSPVTAAEIQVGMNYYVNATISISSDPCPRHKSLERI